MIRKQMTVLTLPLLVLLGTTALGTSAGYCAVDLKIDPNDAAQLRLTEAQKRDYALLQAAYAGETWTVRSLLAKRANIEARDGRYTFTPLMWATQNGHLGTVRYLLSKGAKVNARSMGAKNSTITLSTGRTVATETAPGADNTGAVAATRSNFVTLNNGVTALMLASSGGYALTVKELLAKGADVNAITASGDTALMCAAFNGYLPTVQALLAKGANVHARDGYGSTALAAAVVEGHTRVVRALLAKGAKANVQWRGIPLVKLARYYQYTEIAGLLRRAGASDSTAGSPVRRRSNTSAAATPTDSGARILR